MKLTLYFLAFLSIVCGSSVAWAGPAEEIAQINQQRSAAYEKNDVDGYTAAFADDAVVTAFWIPFRVEGRAAIKAQTALLFETYPKRHGIGAANIHAHLR